MERASSGRSGLSSGANLTTSKSARNSGRKSIVLAQYNQSFQADKSSLTLIKTNEILSLNSGLSE
jgi:hypothetical protein